MMALVILLSKISMSNDNGLACKSHGEKEQIIKC
jgi:hypothetical protein